MLELAVQAFSVMNKGKWKYLEVHISPMNSASEFPLIPLNKFFLPVCHKRNRYEHLHCQPG